MKKRQVVTHCESREIGPIKLLKEGYRWSSTSIRRYNNTRKLALEFTLRRALVRAALCRILAAVDI